jgi:hypothetical protein
MCILSPDAGLEALSESKRYAARLHPLPLLLITLIPISHRSLCACHGFRPVPPPSYPHSTLSYHRQSTCLRHPGTYSPRPPHSLYSPTRFFRSRTILVRINASTSRRSPPVCLLCRGDANYESRARHRCRFGRCGAVDERLCRVRYIFTSSSASRAYVSSSASAPEARAQDARAATATCAALLRRLEIFQGYMRILASIRVHICAGGSGHAPCGRASWQRVGAGGDGGTLRAEAGAVADRASADRGRGLHRLRLYEN